MAQIDMIKFGIPSLDKLLGAHDTETKVYGIRQDNSDYKTETTSFALVGPDGTGKSILALHLLSTYASDAVSNIKKGNSGQMPRCLYLSTDLSYAKANRMWRNFGLAYPTTREIPFETEDERKQRQENDLTYDIEWSNDPNHIHKSLNIKFMPYSPIVSDSSTDNHKSITQYLLDNSIPNTVNNNVEIAFIDLEAESAGDDWGYIVRLISTMEKPKANHPAHMLVVDAVEGLLTRVGERDEFGQERSLRSRIAQIMRVASGKCHVIFVVEEGKEGEHGPVEFVSDVVVRLRNIVVNNYMRRTIEIEKARGQSHVRGQHILLIRNGLGSTTGTQLNADDPMLWQSSSPLFRIEEMSDEVITNLASRSNWEVILSIVDDTCKNKIETIITTADNIIKIDKPKRHSSPEFSELCEKLNTIISSTDNSLSDNYLKPKSQDEKIQHIQSLRTQWGPQGNSKIKRLILEQTVLKEVVPPSQSYVLICASLNSLSRRVMYSRGIERPEYPENQFAAFGIPYLDDMLAGCAESTEHVGGFDERGLPIGTTTSIFGDAGTQKSRLGNAFLGQGFRHYAETLANLVGCLINGKKEEDEFINKYGPFLDSLINAKIMWRESLAYNYSSISEKDIFENLMPQYNKIINKLFEYIKIGDEQSFINLCDILTSSKIIATNIWKKLSKKEQNVKESDLIKILPLKRALNRIRRVDKHLDRNKEYLDFTLIFNSLCPNNYEPKIIAKEWDKYLDTTPEYKENYSDSIITNVFHSDILKLTEFRSVAVLITTYDTDYVKLSKWIMNWLVSNIDLQNLDEESKKCYETHLLKYIQSKVICRRLEIHDSTIPHLFHIVQRTFENALKLVSTENAHQGIERYKDGHRIRVVIDDINVIKDTYADIKTDHLFLPYLLFYLNREGCTSVIIDTRHGRPDSVETETFDSALRGLVQHHLHTWRVHFFGEERVAIAAIPPLVNNSKLPAYVRELKWESNKSKLLVDPHFELYSGLERGDPQMTPLSVRLFAETDECLQFVTGEQSIFDELFVKIPHSQHVLEGISNNEYSSLWDLCHLQSDARTDYTHVFQVDEFWGVGSVRNLRPQGDYLSAFTTDEHGNADEFADPYRLFQKNKEGQPRARRRRARYFDFDGYAENYTFVVHRNQIKALEEFRKKINSIKNDFKKGTTRTLIDDFLNNNINAIIETRSLNRVITNANFSTFLYRFSNLRRITRNLATRILFNHNKRNDIYELVRMNRFLLEDLAGKTENHNNVLERVDEFGAADRVPYIMDFGFLICDKTAWNIASHKHDGYIGSATDPKTMSSIDITIRDVWDNICLKDDRFVNSNGQSKSVIISWRNFINASKTVATINGTCFQPLNLALDGIENISSLVLEVWASEIFQKLRNDINDINQKDVLTDTDTKLKELKEREIRHFLRYLTLRTWSPRNKETGIDLLTWIKKYQVELLSSMVLLSDVMSPQTLSDQDNKIQYTATRHWYKTACKAHKASYPNEMLTPTRLPGNFSVRGDWYLAVSKSSRSSRLADRAMDLLNSRRANIARLQQGMGLPVRNDISQDNSSNRCLTRLPKSNKDASQFSNLNNDDFYQYNEITELFFRGEESYYESGQEPGTADRFWLWRSSLQGYDRHARIWSKWLYKITCIINKILYTNDIDGISLFDEISAHKDFYTNRLKDNEYKENNSDPNKKEYLEITDKFGRYINELRDQLICATPHYEIPKQEEERK